ncbi:MAG: hypothetical protein ABF679_01135 [Lentilactobacillus diolivorans]
MSFNTSENSLLADALAENKFYLMTRDLVKLIVLLSRIQSYYGNLTILPILGRPGGNLLKK